MIVGDIQDMEALENQEAAQAEALENQEAAQAEALENQEAAQADLNAAGAGEVVRGAYIDDYVSAMAFRGLFIQLFSEKELSILMVGLDASGKTTILDKLKLGEIITRFHNDGFYMEAVQYRHINVTAWEVGRPDLIVPLWRQYMGLIFVVDSLDRDRIVEARHELHRMLNEDELEGAVLLVFANKQDLPNAMKAAEITEKLGLRFISRHVWHIQESSATYGQGLYEGLDWFLNKIANKSVAVDLTSRVSSLDLT